MKRGKFLLLLGCVSFYLSCKNSVAEDKALNPNIVFILVDDLGWRDLGFMGNPYYQTPRLDRLSQEGITFTQAYAPAANCAPSRACILSGLHTPKHGIYTVGSSERGKSKDRKLIPTPNKTILADSIFTLAEILNQEGYTSISIGKWHLGEDPLTQGFNYNVAGNKAGHPKSYFSPYKNEDIEDGPEGEYLTDRLTQEAIAFMDEHHQEPFFLYLPYYTVHTPLQGKEDLVSKYDSIIGDDDRYNARFGAMVENMDRNVGHIMDKLEDLGVADNTLLIFFSDNGGLAAVSSQSPLRAGKGSYYEGGIRVPCIIRWPDVIKNPVISDKMISGMDFFPTILDVLEIKDYQNDGQSLLPLIEGHPEEEERTMYWHFPIYLQGVDPEKDEARDNLFRTRPGNVIRKGKWKLHEYFEDGGIELYDLEVDISEQFDLSEEFPEIVNEMQLALKIWRHHNQAPLPIEINKDYQKKD